MRHLLLISSALLTGACQKANGVPAHDTLSVGGAPLTLVQANSAFAVAVYGELARARTGNLVFSPFSLSAGLELASAGAVGATAHEFAKALFLQGSAPVTATAFAALDSQLGRDGAKGDNQLFAANALFGQRGVAFQAPFTGLLSRDYGAPLQEVDFQAHAEGAINSWVSGHTNGQIPEILAPGALESSTRVVLATALYFHGRWARAFDRSRTGDAFFYPGFSPKRVPTMHATASYPYAHVEGFAVLELPYLGGTLALDLVLPDARDGLRAVESSLSRERLAIVFDMLRGTEAEVSIPRFAFALHRELTAPLRALGITLAFDSHAANFSAMDGEDDLFLESVVHAARIEVDEEGTTASAATVVHMGTRSLSDFSAGPIEFTADHPFLFVLRDLPTGEILFLGRVEDPAAHD